MILYTHAMYLLFVFPSPLLLVLYLRSLYVFSYIYFATSLCRARPPAEAAGSKRIIFAH